MEYLEPNPVIIKKEENHEDADNLVNINVKEEYDWNNEDDTIHSETKLTIEHVTLKTENSTSYNEEIYMPKCENYNSNVKIEDYASSESNTIKYEDFQLTNEEVELKPEVPAGLECSRLETSNILHHLDNNRIKKHFMLNNDKPKIFTCSECNFSTKHKPALKKHGLIHKPSNELTMFKCPECSYETRYKGNLRIHMVTHLTQDQITMHKCEKCEYKTKWKGHLNSHMRIHLENPTLYHCDKCEYKTKHPGVLKKHVTSHLKIDEADTVYQCSYCNHKTKNKTRLLKHEKVHLKPIKQGEFICYQCNYQTNNKYILASHLKQHRKPKLKCEYCCYETVHEKRLQGHKKIHINIK